MDSGEVHISDHDFIRSNIVVLKFPALMKQCMWSFWTKCGRYEGDICSCARIL